jgi:hypothetical protein
LHHILPYEHCGIAKFGCKLVALRLKNVASDHPRSLCDEQASLGCALSARSSTDERRPETQSWGILKPLARRPNSCSPSSAANRNRFKTVFAAGSGQWLAEQNKSS